MKKAAIIICAAVYAISIIIVAFLGYKAEVRNPPIFADDIVFAEATPYEHVVNGAVIYKVRELARRTAEDEESTSVDYKYEVEIYEFEYLYKVLGGEMTLPCKPISYKVDAETGEQKQPDELGLHYTSMNENDAVADNDGKLTFKKFKDLGHLHLVVSTIDTSNINIHIKVIWDTAIHS